MSKKLTKVTSITLGGSSYTSSGRHNPPYALLHIEDQPFPVYIPENMAVGFEGVCNYADILGYDTTYIRGVIANWVKTGSFVKE